MPGHDGSRAGLGASALGPLRPIHDVQCVTVDRLASPIVMAGLVPAIHVFATAAS